MLRTALPLQRRPAGLPSTRSCLAQRHCLALAGVRRAAPRRRAVASLARRKGGDAAGASQHAELKVELKVRAVQAASVALGTFLTAAHVMERLTLRAAEALKEAAAADEAEQALQQRRATPSGDSAPAAVDMPAQQQAAVGGETVATEQRPGEAAELGEPQRRAVDAPLAAGLEPVDVAPRAEPEPAPYLMAGRLLVAGSWQQGEPPAAGRQMVASSWGAPPCVLAAATGLAAVPLAALAEAVATDTSAPSVPAEALPAGQELAVPGMATAVSEPEVEQPALDFQLAVHSLAADEAVAEQAAVYEQPAVAAAEEPQCEVVAEAEVYVVAADGNQPADEAAQEPPAVEVEPEQIVAVAAAGDAVVVEVPNGDAVRPGMSVGEAVMDVKSWIEAWRGSSAAELEGAVRHPKVVAEPREGSCIGAEGPEHAQPRAEAAEGASPADVATVLAAMAADAPVGATPVAPDGAVADSEGGVVNGAGCEPGEAMLALTVLAPAGAPPSAQERESQYKARIAAVLADSKLAGAGLALAPASQAAQLQPQALRTRHMAVRSKGVDALQGHAPPALWHSQARQPAASLATQQRQVAEQELLARSDAILRSLAAAEAAERQQRTTAAAARLGRFAAMAQRAWQLLLGLCSLLLAGLATALRALRQGAECLADRLSGIGDEGWRGEAQPAGRATQPPLGTAPATSPLR